jgi:hypothetical protein
LTNDRVEPAPLTRTDGRAAPARKTLRAPSLLRELRKKPALRSLLLALAAARLGRPAGERCGADIECFPGVPYHRHMLWKVAFYAGAKLVPYGGEETGSVRRPRLRLVWPDQTATGAGEPRRPPPPQWWEGALNAGADDESKRKVERVFARTFGYELAVDPTTHRDLCVAKSDQLNGAHDGRILQGPIPVADPALSYQRLIDNRVDPATVLDLRVPIVGGEIPFVYRKYRPLHDRFSNANATVRVACPDDVLSPAERERLGTFARAMGLELGGELDVLRDAGDGRIYVVDVNWTSWGPPRPMRTAEAVGAVRAYAAALARLVEPSSSVLGSDRPKAVGALGRPRSR